MKIVLLALFFIFALVLIASFTGCSGDSSATWHSADSDFTHSQEAK